MTQLPEEQPTAGLLDGRYLLAECVGEGGMARVFRAEDVALGRTVAVKMMRPSADAVASPERTRNEMRVLASVNHPALVTLYDAHVVPGGTEYLVMEFIDGPTLAQRLHDGPLAPDEVAQLAVDLASALHVVHGAGIVHRDVKPSNVLLTPAVLPGATPRAKLTDFGIASLLDRTRVTTPGIVVGTAAYLAPEQVRGEAPAPPADIYALGLVLREALLGERAYPEASGIGAIMARLMTPPTFPDDLDSAWADLLRRMTATEPADRPCAREVAEAAQRLPAVAPIMPVAAPTVPAAAPTVPAAAPTVPAAAPIIPAAAPSPGDVTEALPRRLRRASGPRRRVSRPLILVGSATALVVLVHLGLWASWSSGMPLPGSSVPPLTESTPTPEPLPDIVPASELTPAETEPAEIVPVVEPEPEEPAHVDPGGSLPEQAAEEAVRNAASRAAEEEQRRLDQAQREAELAAQKAQRDAEKAAEKAQRDAKGG